jgi:hypothetical protein
MIIPPAPPNWNGPWPPLPQMTGFNPQFGPGMGYAPPPPPPNFNTQSFQPPFPPQGLYPGVQIPPPPNAVQENWNPQGFQQGWNQANYTGGRGRGRGQ